MREIGENGRIEPQDVKGLVVRYRISGALAPLKAAVRGKLSARCPYCGSMSVINGPLVKAALELARRPRPRSHPSVVYEVC